ncbi:hypothetical protein NE237_000956 [Protea cynaroides]|uniref:ABC1 atypical kinase-like domain-containing protein n=1 Tax=Protea cynaroides TaxID=273540 RepID=A0A9Q0QXM3_9MAGN|nr:hypothetical protein NE237_000956 [Protea cynaroides]
MSRFLSFGNIRRAAHFLILNQRTSYTELKKHGILFTLVLPSSMSRSYASCSFSSRGHASIKLYKVKQNLYKTRYFKNLTFVSAGDNMTHHAQVAWKRLSHICSYGGSAFSPISRIACAVSLALARSHLVAPRIFAFIIGEIAWTHRTWADAEYFPKRNSLDMDAQVGRVYLTSLVFSVLEGVILLGRLIYLAILFSPAMAMAPFVDCFSGHFRKTWLHLVHRTIEIAGPAFIKWGQWAATRPDLFPSDLCTELAKLHSKAPSHSFAYTKRTIEKAFGRKLPEIFENFEEEPIASGSIAQVHRASLRFQFPGQQVKPIVVAVKVRHPSVGEIIRRDFVIINVISKISNFIPTLKWLRLDQSVQQFAVFMMSQVDLAREAALLNRFIYNFRRWKDVSFPKPLYPFVHPAVLVETYEQGESISYYVDMLEGEKRIKCALARIGTHALMKMLLEDNFLHADMHPGNILVRMAHSKTSLKPRPHVIFLDVGMTAELSKCDRENLLGFFKAVALRDGRNAAECTLRLSNQQSCLNPKAFIEEVEKTFSFWDTREGEVFNAAACIQQLLEQVRRHEVNIDGNICTVIVTTLVLEGWRSKLDPKHNDSWPRRSLMLLLSIMARHQLLVSRLGESASSPSRSPCSNDIRMDLLSFHLIFTTTTVLVVLSSLFSSSIAEIPSEFVGDPQQPLKPRDFSNPNTVPAFPVQTQTQSCHLDLSAELFGGVREACGLNLDRSRCCPVLAAWLFAAHARSALQTSLASRDIHIPQANASCDAIICFCGIRLHQITSLSCPAAFNLSSHHNATPTVAVRNLERNCRNSSYSGCTRCLGALEKVKGDEKNVTGGGGEWKETKMLNRDCQLMGLTWLLARNKTAYIPTVSAVLRAMMYSAHPTNLSKCSPDQENMPLAVDSLQFQRLDSSDAPPCRRRLPLIIILFTFLPLLIIIIITPSSSSLFLPI